MNGEQDFGDFARPLVIVSKCLGFAACRYNVQTIPDRFVEQLKKDVDFRPVCPEMAIGLGVPRDPIRIIDVAERKILYQPASGRDVTEKMVDFTKAFLDSVEGVDGFILKNRSPSCGYADVKTYDSRKADARSHRGSGLFGGEVIDRFGQLAVEDEGRLKNFSIREHFLVKLFAIALFRRLKKHATMRGLVEYHTNNKLLFMGYHQARLRQLGKVVANHDRLPFNDVLALYEHQMTQVFSKPPRYTSMINVLLHAFGGFSDKLNDKEKRFFLNTLEEYRDERVPLSVPVHLIKAWSVSYDNTYLLNQTFLKPFPEHLVMISDSGKGRNL